MNTHTVHSFDTALENVIADLLRMARLSRGQLAVALDLLDQPGAVPPVTADEERLDQLDGQIAEAVQRLLALRQPVGIDLRTLVSCDRIATDLERIGDHSVNIVGRIQTIAEQTPPLDLACIQALAQKVLGQLDRLIDAIERRDVAAATAIWRADGEVNALYDETFAAQVEEMCRQPDAASSRVHTLFVAKSLERIGDHVTNCAEDLIYWVDGHRLSKRKTEPAGPT